MDESLFSGKKAGRFESLSVLGSGLVLMVFIIAMFVVVYFVQSQNIQVKFSPSQSKPRQNQATRSLKPGEEGSRR